MAVGIRTDSAPEKTYQGWIGFIASTAEFTPKTVETTELRTKLVYRVRVLVCDPDRELRLGMPVTVAVDTASAARSRTDNRRCVTPADDSSHHQRQANGAILLYDEHERGVSKRSNEALNQEG
jgi:hypothetical protein